MRNIIQSIAAIVLLSGAAAIGLTSAISTSHAAEAQKAGNVHATMHKTEKNAEALRKLLTLKATRWQYTHGTRQVESISPDNWLVDQTQLDRPGNKEIQLALFGSYASNPPHYPKWQAYFRQHQPPTLIVWGKNDLIFPADGAEPYRRDLKNLEFHLIDTGHFALEEEGALIGTLIRGFLAKQKL